MIRFVLQLEARQRHVHPCRLCDATWTCISPECEVDEEHDGEGLPDAEYLDCPACTTGRFIPCAACGELTLRRGTERPRWAKCKDCGHEQVLIHEELE